MKIKFKYNDLSIQEIDEYKIGDKYILPNGNKIEITKFGTLGCNKTVSYRFIDEKYNITMILQEFREHINSHNWKIVQ